MTQFILMLTRDDVTVADARSLVDQLTDTGLRHVGFKDIGLPPDEMKLLADDIRALGAAVHLEVVSLDGDAERRSAEVAADLGVDYLIGGTRWADIGPIAADAGLHYLPYVGRVVGHPATLHGTIDEIATEAADVGARFDGINLLAYRHVDVDPLTLVRAVTAKPVDVIVAGSITTLDQVRDVTAAGAWAFTIGTAVLDRAVVEGASLTEQVTAVLAAT